MEAMKEALLLTDPARNHNYFERFQRKLSNSFFQNSGVVEQHDSFSLS